MVTAHIPAPSAYLRGLYPVGLALTLFPLFDLVARLVPLEPASLQWRFGALGLALSSLSLFLVGVVLLGATAALRRNAGVLRFLAILAWLVAVSVAAALGMFVLDALQLHVRLADPAMRPQFYKAAASALVAGTLHGAAFIGLGFAAWRTARRASEEALRPAHRTEARLVRQQIETARRSPGQEVFPGA